MSRRIAAGVTLLACLWLLGCEGDKADQVDDLFSSASVELCRYLYSCCEPTELTIFRNSFLDQKGCERYVGLLLESDHNLYRLAVSLGGVNVDRAALDTCIAGMRALGCNTLKLSASGPTHPFSLATVSNLESCKLQRLFVGARAAGEACDTVLDCAAGSFCYNTSLVKVKGICSPLRKRGEPCQTSNANCEQGLVCAHPGNLFATCEMPAREGEPCKEVGCDPTDPDLFCDSTKDYRCTRRVRKRENEECQSNLDCQKGLFCDSNPLPPTGRVCARLRPNGQPCTNSVQCESQRCDYISKICQGSLCDGKNNGPPPQLDLGVPDTRRDWRAWYDRPRPDRFVFPDRYSSPDRQQADVYRFDARPAQ